MTEEKRNENFGLWKKTSKSWLTYMNWTLTVDGKEYYMSVFKNSKKTKDTQPDWNLVLTPKEPQEDMDEDDWIEEIPF